MILHLPFTIPLYGNFVAGFTVLMGLSMIVQMRMQMDPAASNPQTKMLTYMMPVMLFVFFNRLAAGLSLYYLVFNVLTAVQQRFINKGLEKKREAAGEEDPHVGKRRDKSSKVDRGPQKRLSRKEKT